MLSSKLCKELRDIAANFIPAKDLDDLVQEVFLQLLQMEPAKLADLIDKGDLHRYFNRMCKLNYYSKNSRYYYKYNKIREFITFVDRPKPKQYDDILYTSEDSSLINTILDELYWYDRELFKLYVLGDDENGKYTYTRLSKKTGISRISIYYTIRGVKRYVTKRLNEMKDDVQRTS